MGSPSDQELDEAVATMLRIGVSVAALVVVIGGFLLFRHPWTPVPDYESFQEGNPALRNLMGIVQGAIDLAPKSVIQLGLVILIVTPVARVALCVVGFARQKNILYVGISLLVLLVLIFSLFRGS